MPKPATQLAYNFIGHLNYLETTRRKMEKLLAQKDIVRRDIEQVYEGLFLDVVSTFESICEDLFLGLLTNRYTVSQPFRAKITFEKPSLARDICYGGKKYLDWLPYEQHTLKRAGIFFRDAYPFSRLESGHKNLLQVVGVVRNAIAHSSAYSYSKFIETAVGSTPLPPREKSPAGFLRSIFRISPNQTRYENFTVELTDIVRKITA